jgi:diguanylate cyclase (GGDEF)-like protein
METPSLDISLQIMSQSPMGIAITNRAGNILWCNDTLASWAGSSAAGQTEAQLLNTDSPGAGPHRLGSDRWVMRCPLEAIDDQQAICYLDVSDEELLRREVNLLAQQLEQHNTVDPVSGLLNERAINKGLEPLVSRSRRYQNPLSAVTMKVTNLDALLQSGGQVPVDKAVRSISYLLRDQMRWADLVGRTDDGHFLFVLPETDLEASIALANKIAAQLREMRISLDDNTPYHPEACFGVATWTRGDDGNLLLNRSAEAAQAAIQNGAFAVQAA